MEEFKTCQEHDDILSCVQLRGYEHRKGKLFHHSIMDLASLTKVPSKLMSMANLAKLGMASLTNVATKEKSRKRLANLGMEVLTQLP